MKPPDEVTIASMYCFMHHKESTEADREALARLLQATFDHGVSTGLETAKETYINIHSGHCRMMSQGDSCRCFLCQMDELRNVLGNPLDLTEGEWNCTCPLPNDGTSCQVHGLPESEGSL